MAELEFLSAIEQARLVRERQVSPVELVELYLRRIEKHDGHLNSYVTVAADEALRAAAEAEERVQRGGELPPFHGVPISIKDLNETKGIRTTFSCRAFADYVPAIDGSTVRRIKEAGFIVLGKTNTPEFGTIPMTESDLNGICRNPWDMERTPGGSSGGAAAALAAGLCPVAQGSDGGGSIRIPASCCGLFGIKPARGRVSHAPRVGDSLNGLSTDGPIARTVADAAALLDVMEGYETGDPYWAPAPERPFLEEVGADPGKLRVAVTTTPPLDAELDADVVAATNDAARLLESLGHEVEEATPDWHDRNVMAFFTTLWQAGSAYYEVAPADQIEPLNRTLRESARATSSSQFIQAVAWLQQLARRIVAFWEDYDLVLTPTLALKPVPVGWLRQEDDPWVEFAKAGLFVPFTPVVNVTGQPAVSLPLYWSEDGLPIGVQLIGRPADEATVIRASAQLEEARPWKERRPPVS